MIDWLFLGAVFAALCASLCYHLNIVDMQQYSYPDYKFLLFREVETYIYYAIFWICPWRATPGMLLMNLQVTDSNKNTLTIGASLIRYILFSSWLLYIHRRVLIGYFTLGTDSTPYEVIEHLVPESDMVNMSKHLLMIFMFILPCFFTSRTLPDILSGAHVSIKDTENWWKRFFTPQKHD